MSTNCYHIRETRKEISERRNLNFVLDGVKGDVGSEVREVRVGHGHGGHLLVTRRHLHIVLLVRPVALQSQPTPPAVAGACLRGSGVCVPGLKNISDKRRRKKNEEEEEEKGGRG